MLDWLVLIVALGIILLGATIFTNGLEWLGKKLNLSDGVVGSIFAAVGTALPETLIPIIAIFFGTAEAGHKIGVGAIIGAPFMLGTLAFFLAGLTVVLNRRKRPDYPAMRVNSVVMRRDLLFFLIVYSIAILSTFLPHHSLKIVAAAFLALCYVIYVYRTMMRSNDEHEVEENEIGACYFAPRSHDPHLAIIIFQVLCALALIVWGADVFVEKVQIISIHLGISPFILSLIIAPIATELPEKFNSVIWIIKGKDTLALGNITGAMVFQSSVIPAIGILLTDWNLGPSAFLTAGLTLFSAAMAYVQLRWRKVLTPITLLVGGAFYLLFIALVLTGSIR